MADLDAVMARLERLEAENVRLQRLVDDATGGSVPAPTPTDERPASVSRRGFLRGAGVRLGGVAFGAVAAVGAGLGSAVGVRAGGNGTPVEVGESHTGTIRTWIKNLSSNAQAVLVASHEGAGDAVVGNANLGNGLTAGSRSGIGAAVSSLTGLGLAVNSDSGPGARIVSEGLGLEIRSLDGRAVDARALGKGPGIRVDATQGSGLVAFQGPLRTDRKVPRSSGVHGESRDGYGGSFAGGKAAVRLMPTSRSDHPETGVRGDLLVDSTGRLWFCRGGTDWVQLDA